MRITRQFCTLNFEILEKYFPKSVKPSNEHLKCLEERQNNKMSRPIAITTGLCKYGYPQASVQYPVDMSTGAAQSGMLRLTCPNLVKEIDEYEGAGAVKSFNVDIATQADVSINYKQVNRDWRKIRSVCMTDVEKQFVRDKLGSDSEHFFSSGIIGVPSDR